MLESTQPSTSVHFSRCSNLERQHFQKTLPSWVRHHVDRWCMTQFPTPVCREVAYDIFAGLLGANRKQGHVSVYLRLSIIYLHQPRLLLAGLTRTANLLALETGVDTAAAQSIVHCHRRIGWPEFPCVVGTLFTLDWELTVLFVVYGPRDCTGLKSMNVSSNGGHSCAEICKPVTHAIHS